MKYRKIEDLTDEELYRKVKKYIEKNEELNSQIKTLEKEIYLWFQFYGVNAYDIRAWPKGQKSHALNEREIIYKLPFRGDGALLVDKCLKTAHIVKLYYLY